MIFLVLCGWLTGPKNNKLTLEVHGYGARFYVWRCIRWNFATCIRRNYYYEMSENATSYCELVNGLRYVSCSLQYYETYDTLVDFGCLWVNSFIADGRRIAVPGKFALPISRVRVAVFFQHDDHFTYDMLDRVSLSIFEVGWRDVKSFWAWFRKDLFSVLVIYRAQDGRTQ